MGAQSVSFPDLCAAIGTEYALILCRAYGGIESIRIPATPAPHHPYAQLLGTEVLSRMITAFGQGYFSFPNMRKPDDDKKHVIVAMLSRGVPHITIALATGRTERWVRQVESDMRRPVPKQRQLKFQGLAG